MRQTVHDEHAEGKNEEECDDGKDNGNVSMSSKNVALSDSVSTGVPGSRRIIRGKVRASDAGERVVLSRRNDRLAGFILKVLRV